jgi:ElaB/YqjD/DUF883 family membrane-anchored ribosome-binding protein
MNHHDAEHRAKQAAARAQHLAHSAIDDAKLRLDKLRREARYRGQAFLDEVKDRGNDLLKEARGQGRKVVRTSSEWISENPIQSVGIAFAAGVIVAGLFTRGED